MNNFRERVYILNYFILQIRHCKLLYTHTLEEIKEILIKLDQRLKNKDYAEVKVYSIESLALIKILNMYYRSMKKTFH